MESIKKYWGWIVIITTIIGGVIGYYNNAHTWIYNQIAGDIHEKEYIRPKLDIILPHADSIGYYKTEFINLALNVHQLQMQQKKIQFQATQSMKQIYYYVMVYEKVLDQHGCAYHLRRFPDDGSPSAIQRRDYWKMVDDIIYLVETSNEGVYYNDYMNRRVDLKHRWPGSNAQNEE